MTNLALFFFLCVVHQRKSIDLLLGSEIVSETY